MRPPISICLINTSLICLVAVVIVLSVPSLCPAVVLFQDDFSGDESNWDDPGNSFEVSEGLYKSRRFTFEPASYVAPGGGQTANRLSLDQYTATVDVISATGSGYLETGGFWYNVKGPERSIVRLATTGDPLGLPGNVQIQWFDFLGGNQLDDFGPVVNLPAEFKMSLDLLPTTATLTIMDTGGNVIGSDTHVVLNPGAGHFGLASGRNPVPAQNITGMAYDNYVLEVIPEPSSAVLAGGSLLGLLSVGGARVKLRK